MSEITPTGRTYTMRRVDILDQFPEIPEKATEYESHQMSMAWRNALRACEQLAGYAEEIHEDLVEGGANHRLGAGLGQQVTDLAYALGQLSTMVDAVHHRLRLAEKEARTDG